MYFEKTIQMKKTSKRPLTLIVSKDEFDRFTDFKTETEKLSEIADKKYEKLSQLKKLSYEITKDWHDAMGTVQKRRREELLSRRKKVEDTKVKLIEELTKKNELERAKIVKEAQKLILYRKPQCRLMNRALLASECYRELNAQLDFKKKLVAMEQNEEIQYIDELKRKTEIHVNEEKKRRDERLKKMQEYGIELKKQIEESNSQSQRIQMQEINADKEDLINMNKELQLIEKCEADQEKMRKEEAKKNYLDAMKEKKCIEAKIKHDDEMENQLIASYAKAKDHLNKITEKKWKQSQADKLHRSELMAGKCAIIWKSNDDEAEEKLKKDQEHYKEVELEKLESKRIMQKKMRADIEKYRTEFATMKAKRREEEKNLIAWEMLQRYKRDEYNKTIKLRELQRVWKNKMEIASDLQKQMAEQEAARKRELIMDDDSAYIKSALEKTNEKVIAYGQEILQESKGVRPLFPIIKAIETFQKDNGLIQPRKYEEIDWPIEYEERKRIHVKQLVSSGDTFYLG